jgi:hypothetical protein
MFYIAWVVLFRFIILHHEKTVMKISILLHTYDAK